MSQVWFRVKLFTTLSQILPLFQYVDGFNRDRISAFALQKADDAQLQQFGVSNKAHRQRIQESVSRGDLKRLIDSAQDAVAPPRPASANPRPSLSTAPEAFKSPEPAAAKAFVGKTPSKSPSMAAVAEEANVVATPPPRPPSAAASSVPPSKIAANPMVPATPTTDPSTPAPPRPTKTATPGSVSTPVASAGESGPPRPNKGSVVDNSKTVTPAPTADPATFAQDAGTPKPRAAASASSAQTRTPQPAQGEAAAPVLKPKTPIQTAVTPAPPPVTVCLFIHVIFFFFNLINRQGRHSSAQTDRRQGDG